MASNSIQTTSKTSHLPDDCWEYIFKFIISDDGHVYNSCYFKSLSLVSKQFLSITNRLLFSLTICSGTPRPLLLSLFQRFTNLISLNFGYSHDVHVDLLSEISHFPLKLTSLCLSVKPTIPTNGLRAFSQNITTLTSFTCSEIPSISGTNLFLIAQCFPLLEELDLSNPKKLGNYDSLQNGVKTLSSTLLKLRKVNLTGHQYINDQLLVHLFNNWKLLEEAVIFYCDQITKYGIASALSERPTLRSLSFSRHFDPKNRATCFALDAAALVSNSSSLSKISLNYKYKTSVENPNHLFNVAVSPQLESLCLANNFQLRDESIKIFVIKFPNLQFLNLSNCRKISENVIYQVLKRCCKIRHLDLTGCSLKLLGLNFEVPNLEVLNLSQTEVDDETLYVISKSCRMLMQLLLKFCYEVTENGVKHVVENCTQLREMNLRGCSKVDGNVVASMVISRPLLRMITAPSCPFARCQRLHIIISEVETIYQV